MAPGPSSTAALVCCFAAQFGLVWFTQVSRQPIADTTTTTPAVAGCPVAPPPTCPAAGYPAWQVFALVACAFLIGAGAASLLLAAASLTPGALAGALAGFCSGKFSGKTVTPVKRHEAGTSSGDGEGSPDPLPLCW